MDSFVFVTKIKKTKKFCGRFFLVKDGERGTGERKRTKEIVTAARSCKRVKGHKIQFPTMSIYAGTILILLLLLNYIQQQKDGRAGRGENPAIGWTFDPPGTVRKNKSVLFCAARYKVEILFTL